MGKTIDRLDSVQDQLHDHLRDEPPFALFGDVDFASTVFGFIQGAINDHNLSFDADDIGRLLDMVKALRFSAQPDLNEVSEALHQCVVGFLKTLKPQPLIIGEVVHHEVKMAKDGVYRLFPVGHRFEDDEDDK